MSDETPLRDEYLTSKEAQEYLKISSVTLWRLVKEGQLPVYKIHNRNRYRKMDLDAFMEANRVGPVMDHSKPKPEPDSSPDS
ncbi:MAG: helix-turn-helix domain-containing protein [Candidatus Lindowbacteria bacterium]|nr:helix-turn-helix domain-containing protein [Candidatus Lindowbacteria bacterium]